MEICIFVNLVSAVGQHDLNLFVSTKLHDFLQNAPGARPNAVFNDILFSLARSCARVFRLRRRRRGGRGNALKPSITRSLEV